MGTQPQLCLRAPNPLRQMTEMASMGGRHILVYGPDEGTMPHSDACRARISQELSKTASGRARLERMNARTAEESPATAQGRDEDNVPQQATPSDFIPFQEPPPALQPPAPAQAVPPQAPSIDVPLPVPLEASQPPSGDHQSPSGDYPPSGIHEDEGDGMDVGITECDLRALLNVHVAEMRDQAR